MAPMRSGRTPLDLMPAMVLTKQSMSRMQPSSNQEHSIFPVEVDGDLVEMVADSGEDVLSMSLVLSRWKLQCVCKSGVGLMVSFIECVSHLVYVCSVLEKSYIETSSSHHDSMVTIPKERTNSCHFL